MTSERFANLLRLVAQRPTRRGMGRILACSVFGGALGVSALLEAEGKRKKRKKKKKCNGGKKRCGKKCFDLQSDAGNCGTCGNECASGTCVHGACTCTTNDECPESCATCGTRVQGGSACADGFDNSAVCESDDDCPVGSFCASVFVPRCSIPCGE